MKNKYIAFTIPELLVFLTIVGVVGTLMMSMIKPNERYLPYAYYSAYNALNTAVFNIKEDAIANAQINDDAIAAADKRFPGSNVVNFPLPSNRPAFGEDDETIAARALCKKLAVNPAGGDDYGYINTTEYACTNFVTANTTGVLAADVTPAFRATNSMTFYISKLMFLKSSDAAGDSDSKVSVGVFIVWVDLNGNRRPNTTAWTSSKPADRVPFLITTTGVVIPIGAPTFDARYSTSRVQYSADSVSRYSNKSFTFLEAQYRAYGGNEYPNYDVLSITPTIITKFDRAIYKTDEVKTILENVSKTFDDRCQVSDGAHPICSVSLDENRGL